MTMHRYRCAISTVLTAVATAVALLAGCQSPNDQNGLVGVEPLAALTVDAETGVTSDAPSLIDHDRSHWPRVSVPVAVRQVAHHPTYAPQFEFGPDDPRHRGEYPTARTAARTHEQNGRDVLRAMREIVQGFVMIPWAPIDMVLNDRWPWSVERSPSMSYAILPGAQWRIREDARRGLRDGG